jgi:hypothetical protein
MTPVTSKIERIAIGPRADTSETGVGQEGWIQREMSSMGSTPVLYSPIRSSEISTRLTGGTG